MGVVSIKEKSNAPKYKQIVTSIEDAIVVGTLKKGDKLPSLNKVKDTFSLSRDTVIMAFNELKSRGIIKSVVGKGYYIISEDINVTQKIFLLFDELNSFKEDLYNSFLNSLDDSIEVDIFFHHFNYDMFYKLIYNNIGLYNYYVIMPANLEGTEAIIEKLSKNKVYILDQVNEELSGYASIYQNFKKNIYDGLKTGKKLIKKYNKVILLFSSEKQPKALYEGFQAFCDDYNFENEIILSLENRQLNKGELYVVLDDKNLIRIIKKIKDTQLILALDIGIICYNDTLLKEVVEGGITTISTDFSFMGSRLANMILNREYMQIESPNNLIVRKSL